MRALSFLLLLAASTGCGIQLAAPARLGVSAGAVIRAEAHVQVQVQAQAALPLDGSAAIEFFGVPLEGAQDILFVLDRSGSMSEPAQGPIAHLGASGGPSMGPRKIDVAHRELIDALERLPQDTRMNVVFFNHTLEAFAPNMVPLGDSGREQLAGFVTKTRPTGSTALAAAMRIAFLMNARRVVLLSDGLGNVGGDARAILRDAREAMRGGVRIDTIGLGADQDAQLLQALATESGGLYQRL